MRHVICFCTIIIFSICAHATHIDYRHKLRGRYANLLDDVDDFDNIVEPERYQKDIYGSISGKNDDVSQAIRKVDVLDLTGIDNDINIKRDVDSNADGNFNDMDKSKKVQHRKIRTSSDLRKYENLLNLKYGGFKRFRRKRSKIKDKRYINILPPQLFAKHNSYIGYLAEATNDKLLKMQNYAATMMVILTTAKPLEYRNQDQAALYQSVTQDAKLVDPNNITGIMMSERSVRSNKGLPYQSADPNITLVGIDRSSPLQNIPVFTGNYPVYARQGPPINEANFQNASIARPTFFHTAVNVQNASIEHQFIKAPSGSAMSLNVNKVFDVPIITANAVDNTKHTMDNDVMLLQGRDLNRAINLTSVNMEPNLNVTTNVVHMQPNNQMHNIPQQQQNPNHNAQVPIRNIVQLKNYSQGLINVPAPRSYNINNNVDKLQRYISVSPESDVNKIAGEMHVAKSSTSSMINLTNGAMLLNATPSLNSNAFNVNVMTDKNDIKTISLEPPPGIKFNTNYVTDAFSINSSTAADLYIDHKTQKLVVPYHSTSHYNRAQQLQHEAQSNVSQEAKFHNDDLYFMGNNGANRNFFASDDVDDDEDSVNKRTNISMQEEEGAQDENYLMGDDISNNYKMHQLTRAADKNNRNNKAALYDNGRYKRDSKASGADVAMNGHQDFRRGGTQDGYGEYKKSIDTSKIANGTYTARIIDPRLLMNNDEILNAINAVPFNFVENANMPDYGDSMNIRNVIPFQGGNISLLLNYNQTTVMSSNLASTTPASNTTTTHPSTYSSSRKTTFVSDNPYYWENNILREAKIRIRKNDSVPPGPSSIETPLANSTLINSDMAKNFATTTTTSEVVENVSDNIEKCQDVLQADVLNHGVNISITTIIDEDDDFNRPKECMKNDMHCQTDSADEDSSGIDIVCSVTTPLPEYVNVSSINAASKQGNSNNNTNNSSDVKMSNPNNVTGNNTPACAHSKFLTCTNTTDEDLCMGEVGDHDEKENCEEGVPKFLNPMQLECADPRAKVKPPPPNPVPDNDVLRKKSVRIRRHVENKVSKVNRKSIMAKMSSVKTPAPTIHTPYNTNRSKRLHIIPHLVTNFEASGGNRQLERQNDVPTARIDVLSQTPIMEDILHNLMIVDEQLDEALAPLHLAENELVGLANQSVSTSKEFKEATTSDVYLATESNTPSQYLENENIVATQIDSIGGSIVVTGQIGSTVDVNELISVSSFESTIDVVSSNTVSSNQMLGSIVNIETVTTELPSTTVSEVEGVLVQISTLLGNVPLGDLTTECISFGTATELVGQLGTDVTTCIEMSPVTTVNGVESIANLLDVTTIPVIESGFISSGENSSVSDSVNEFDATSNLNDSCPLFFAVKFDVNTIDNQSSQVSTPPGCISFFTIPVNKINAELRKIIENLNVQNQKASGALSNCFAQHPVNSKVVRSQNHTHPLDVRKTSIQLLHKPQKKVTHSTQHTVTQPYDLDVNKFLADLTAEEQDLLSKLAGQLIEPDVKARSIKNVEFLPQDTINFSATKAPIRQQLAPTKSLLKRATTLAARSQTKTSKTKNIKSKKFITKHPVTKKMKNIALDYDVRADNDLSFNKRNRLQRDLAVAKQLQKILNNVEEEHSHNEDLARIKRQPDIIASNKDEFSDMDDELDKRNSRFPSKEAFFKPVPAKFYVKPVALSSDDEIINPNQILRTRYLQQVKSPQNLSLLRVTPFSSSSDKKRSPSIYGKDKKPNFQFPNSNYNLSQSHQSRPLTATTVKAINTKITKDINFKNNTPKFQFPKLNDFYGRTTQLHLQTGVTIKAINETEEVISWEKDATDGGTNLSTSEPFVTATSVFTAAIDTEDKDYIADTEYTLRKSSTEEEKVNAPTTPIDFITDNQQMLASLKELQPFLAGKYAHLMTRITTVASSPRTSVIGTTKERIIDSIFDNINDSSWKDGNPDIANRKLSTPNLAVLLSSRMGLPAPTKRPEQDLEDGVRRHKVTDEFGDVEVLNLNTEGTSMQPFPLLTAVVSDEEFDSDYSVGGVGGVSTLTTIYVDDDTEEYDDLDNSPDSTSMEDYNNNDQTTESSFVDVEADDSVFENAFDHLNEDQGIDEFSDEITNPPESQDNYEDTNNQNKNDGKNKTLVDSIENIEYHEEEELSSTVSPTGTEQSTSFNVTTFFSYEHHNPTLRSTQFHIDEDILSQPYSTAVTEGIELQELAATTTTTSSSTVENAFATTNSNPEEVATNQTVGTTHETGFVFETINGPLESPTFSETIGSTEVTSLEYINILTSTEASKEINLVEVSRATEALSNSSTPERFNEVASGQPYSSTFTEGTELQEFAATTTSSSTVENAFATTNSNPEEVATNQTVGTTHETGFVFETINGPLEESPTFSETIGSTEVTSLESKEINLVVVSEGPQSLSSSSTPERFNEVASSQLYSSTFTEGTELQEFATSTSSSTVENAFATTNSNPEAVATSQTVTVGGTPISLATYETVGEAIGSTGITSLEYTNILTSTEASKEINLVVVSEGPQSLSISSTPERFNEVASSQLYSSTFTEGTELQEFATSTSSSTVENAFATTNSNPEEVATNQTVGTTIGLTTHETGFVFETINGPLESPTFSEAIGSTELTSLEYTNEVSKEISSVEVSETAMEPSNNNQEMLNVSKAPGAIEQDASESTKVEEQVTIPAGIEATTGNYYTVISEGPSQTTYSDVKQILYTQTVEEHFTSSNVINKLESVPTITEDLKGYYTFGAGVFSMPVPFTAEELWGTSHTIADFGQTNLPEPTITLSSTDTVAEITSETPQELHSLEDIEKIGSTTSAHMPTKPTIFINDSADENILPKIESMLKIFYTTANSTTEEILDLGVASTTPSGITSDKSLLEDNPSTVPTEMVGTSGSTNHLGNMATESSNIIPQGAITHVPDVLETVTSSIKILTQPETTTQHTFKLPITTITPGNKESAETTLPNIEHNNVSSPVMETVSISSTLGNIITSPHPNDLQNTMNPTNGSEDIYNTSPFIVSISGPFEDSIRNASTPIVQSPEPKLVLQSIATDGTTWLKEVVGKTKVQSEIGLTTLNKELNLSETKRVFSELFSTITMSPSTRMDDHTTSHRNMTLAHHTISEVPLLGSKTVANPVSTTGLISSEAATITSKPLEEVVTSTTTSAAESESTFLSSAIGFNNELTYQSTSTESLIYAETFESINNFHNITEGTTVRSIGELVTVTSIDEEMPLSTVAHLENDTEEETEEFSEMQSSETPSIFFEFNHVTGLVEQTSKSSLVLLSFETYKDVIGNGSAVSAQYLHTTTEEENENMTQYADMGLTTCFTVNMTNNEELEEQNHINLKTTTLIVPQHQNVPLSTISQYVQEPMLQTMKGGVNETTPVVNVTLFVTTSKDGFESLNFSGAATSTTPSYTFLPYTNGGTKEEVQMSTIHTGKQEVVTSTLNTQEGNIFTTGAEHTHVFTSESMSSNINQQYLLHTTAEEEKEHIIEYTDMGLTTYYTVNMTNKEELEEQNHISQTTNTLIVPQHQNVPLSTISQYVQEPVLQTMKGGVNEMPVVNATLLSTTSKDGFASLIFSGAATSTTPSYTFLPYTNGGTKEEVQMSTIHTGKQEVVTSTLNTQEGNIFTTGAEHTHVFSSESISQNFSEQYLHTSAEEENITQYTEMGLTTYYTVNMTNKEELEEQEHISQTTNTLIVPQHQNVPLSTISQYVQEPMLQTMKGGVNEMPVVNATLLVTTSKDGFASLFFSGAATSTTPSYTFLPYTNGGTNEEVRTSTLHTGNQEVVNSTLNTQEGNIFTTGAEHTHVFSSEFISQNFSEQYLHTTAEEENITQYTDIGLTTCYMVNITNEEQLEEQEHISQTTNTLIVPQHQNVPLSTISQYVQEPMLQTMKGGVNEMPVVNATLLVTTSKDGFAMHTIESLNFSESATSTTSYTFLPHTNGGTNEEVQTSTLHTDKQEVVTSTLNTQEGNIFTTGAEHTPVFSSEFISQNFSEQYLHTTAEEENKNITQYTDMGLTTYYTVNMTNKEELEEQEHISQTTNTLIVPQYQNVPLSTISQYVQEPMLQTMKGGVNEMPVVNATLLVTTSKDGFASPIFSGAATSTIPSYTSLPHTNGGTNEEVRTSTLHTGNQEVVTSILNTQEGNIFTTGAEHTHVFSSESISQNFSEQYLHTTAEEENKNITQYTDMGLTTCYMVNITNEEELEEQEHTRTTLIAPQHQNIPLSTTNQYVQEPMLQTMKGGVNETPVVNVTLLVTTSKDGFASLIFSGAATSTTPSYTSLPHTNGGTNEEVRTSTLHTGNQEVVTSILNTQEGNIFTTGAEHTHVFSSESISQNFSEQPHETLSSSTTLLSGLPYVNITIENAIEVPTLQTAHEEVAPEMEHIDAKSQGDSRTTEDIGKQHVAHADTTVTSAKGTEMTTHLMNGSSSTVVNVNLPSSTHVEYSTRTEASQMSAIDMMGTQIDEQSLGNLKSSTTPSEHVTIISSKDEIELFTKQTIEEQVTAGVITLNVSIQTEEQAHTSRQEEYKTKTTNGPSLNVHSTVGNNFEASSTPGHEHVTIPSNEEEIELSTKQTLEDKVVIVVGSVVTPHVEEEHVDIATSSKEDSEVTTLHESSSISENFNIASSGAVEEWENKHKTAHIVSTSATPGNFASDLMVHISNTHDDRITKLDFITLVSAPSGTATTKTKTNEEIESATEAHETVKPTMAAESQFAHETALKHIQPNTTPSKMIAEEDVNVNVGHFPAQDKSTLCVACEVDDEDMSGDYSIATSKSSLEMDVLLASHKSVVTNEFEIRTSTAIQNLDYNVVHSSSLDESTPCEGCTVTLENKVVEFSTPVTETSPRATTSHFDSVDRNEQTTINVELEFIGSSTSHTLKEDLQSSSYLEESLKTSLSTASPASTNNTEQSEKFTTITAASHMTTLQEDLSSNGTHFNSHDESTICEECTVEEGKATTTSFKSVMALTLVPAQSSSHLEESLNTTLSVEHLPSANNSEQSEKFTTSTAASHMTTLQEDLSSNGTHFNSHDESTICEECTVEEGKATTTSFKSVMALTLVPAQSSSQLDEFLNTTLSVEHLPSANNSEQSEKFTTSTAASHITSLQEDLSSNGTHFNSHDESTICEECTVEEGKATTTSFKSVMALTFVPAQSSSQLDEFLNTTLSVEHLPSANNSEQSEKFTTSTAASHITTLHMAATESITPVVDVVTLVLTEFPSHFEDTLNTTSSAESISSTIVEQETIETESSTSMQEISTSVVEMPSEESNVNKTIIGTEPSTSTITASSEEISESSESTVSSSETMEPFQNNTNKELQYKITLNPLRIDETEGYPHSELHSSTVVPEEIDQKTNHTLQAITLISPEEIDQKTNHTLQAITLTSPEEFEISKDTESEVQILETTSSELPLSTDYNESQVSSATKSSAEHFLLHSDQQVIVEVAVGVKQSSTNIALTSEKATIGPISIDRSEEETAAPYTTTPPVNFTTSEAIATMQKLIEQTLTSLDSQLQILEGSTLSYVNSNLVRTSTPPTNLLVNATHFDNSTYTDTSDTLHSMSGKTGTTKETNANTTIDMNATTTPTTNEFTMPSIYIDLPTYLPEPMPNFTPEGKIVDLFDDERNDTTINIDMFRSMKLNDFKVITEFPVTPEITTVACQDDTCLRITIQNNLDEEQFTTATSLSNPAISSSIANTDSSISLCNSNSTCEIETDATSQQFQPSLAVVVESVTTSQDLPKFATVETESAVTWDGSGSTSCVTENVQSYSESFNLISSTNNNMSSLLSIIVDTTLEPTTTSETIHFKTNTQYVHLIPSELVEETTNADVGTTVWKTITAIGTTTAEVVEETTNADVGTTIWETITAIGTATAEVGNDNAGTTIPTATFQAEHEESTSLSPDNGTICALQEVSGGKQMDFELQLATPISTDGNNSECPVKDYNASRSCVCSIDVFLKDLKQKTTQREFAESVEKYLCNSFVPINKGIKLGLQIASEIQQIRRSKREAAVETGEMDVHKRDVIQNAEILHALENDFQIRNTDKEVYASPGGEVKINCAPPPLESTTGTWIFNGKSLTEGKVVEGDGFITLDTIVPQDGGNYTCTDIHGLRHVHKLSVITLPFFIVNASTLYEVSDSCEEKNADSLQKYLIAELSDMLCGSELKICNLVVHNTHCVHKGTKDYLDTSIELGMEPLDIIMPNLNKTDCDITCQLKLYSRMVGILIKNLDIFQLQPVYFNASGQESMVLRPMEAESNADNEGTAASKLIISCAPGFGLIPGSHICEACLPNTFSAGDEAFCINCPSATYQPTAGCKSCLTCNSIFDDILCVRGIIFEGNHFAYLIAIGGSILVLLTVGLGCSLAKKGGSKDPTDCSQVHSRRRKKRRRTTDADDVEKQDDYNWHRNSRGGRSIKENGSPIAIELLRS